MRLYNTLTRQKEEFVPLDGKNVKMYVCGPTVYDYFHIGNARCFVVFDMLRRYMEYRGYSVRMVQNFTDVDDKMIRRAGAEGTTVAAIAERYIGEYRTDAQGLGIHPATVHPRATENIDEIIAIIEKLVEGGYAYASGGDVYFSTKKFPEYGKLSHMPIEDLESGARIDVSEQKQDALDFALWKAAKPGEPHWTSPWGEGRPGWHIECSAMARRYLGASIDLHCGGQDLTFPHHENEIAQSECANGVPFARYWVHNGYINIDNKKMSKSVGNFFTVRDIAKTYGYGAIRFFILSAHYRSPVNFSEEIIASSRMALERILNCVDAVRYFLSNTAQSPLREEERAQAQHFAAARESFVTAMDDDFNTADGIAVIFELVKELNLLVNAEDKPSSALIAQGAEVLEELTALMGFVREEETVDAAFAAEIEALIAARAAAKKEKNYAEADRIRADLAARGVTLEDTRDGTKYKIER